MSQLIEILSLIENSIIEYYLFFIGFLNVLKIICQMSKLNLNNKII